MYPAPFVSLTAERVEALQITEENLEEVAAWTDGEVVRFTKPLLSGDYTWVGIRFPTKERVVHASVGEWVVLSETRPDRFRSYPNKVFQNMFAHI